MRVRNTGANRRETGACQAERACPAGLIVDDDEESREVMASCVEGRCAVVETAASAAQALDVLSRTPIDVLLTELAMPGEDGYTLLRKLRASNGPTPRSIPAIAVTAFAHREDREQVARLRRATAAEASSY